MIKLLNWNTEANRTTPKSRNNRFERIRQKIQHYQADIICLTEAYPQTMPDDGYTISSDLSGWNKHEAKGARKVVLWSKSGWFNVDTIGSADLPEGRFISAKTIINETELTIVGMCIPYHDYRNREAWGAKRKARWQGACDYLDALRSEILSQAEYQRNTILLGDFNLQIPAHNYPYPSETVNTKREQTFDTWQIPTSGDIDDPALDKRFIDHIALSSDLNMITLEFISRFDESHSPLSDHNGVCIEVEVK